MAVVSGCGDGRSVIFDASGVFPRDDEKIRLCSVSVEWVMTGTGMIWPLQGNHKRGETFY